MWCNLLWLFVLSGVIKGGLPLLDSSNESSGSTSSESSSSEEDGVFSYLLGDSDSQERIKCGPKSKCLTHECRLDPAVIHGYCCGCRNPSDESPYLCPLDMQCPINTDILCSQFRYRIKCCCPEGVRDKPKKL